MKNLFLILFSFFLFACSNSQSTSDASDTETIAETGQSTKSISKKLAVNDFMQQYEASSGGTLLDVRTPEEVAAGVIPTAKSMNFYDENFQNSLQELDKTKPVFVYCKSGGRSGKACGILKEMGFNEIYDLEGGYTSWAANKK